jgi:hypothetical protein
MARLHDGGQVPSSGEKPPIQKKLYYGVKKCYSLKGPAIFLNWTDCKFFVGTENDDNIEYQSFDKAVDATNYMTFQQGVNASPGVVLDTRRATSLPHGRHAKVGAHPTQESVSPHDEYEIISNEKPLPTRNHQKYYGIRKCYFLKGPSIIWNWQDREFFVGSEEDDNIEYQTFTRIIDAAKYVTFQRGAINSKTGIIYPETSTALSNGRDRPSEQEDETKDSCVDLEPRIDRPSHASETEPVDPDIDMLCSGSADGDDSDACSTTDRLETHQTSGGVFERHLERLKEYIIVYGTASVVAADCCEERFMGLNRFVVEWRFNARNIAKGRTKQTSASFAKIRQLIDLGVDLGVDPKAICRQPAPPASDDGSETAIQVALLEIPRGKSSQEFERSFQLLKEYKGTCGTTLPPSSNNCCHGKFKTVRSFLRKWRAHRVRQGKTQQSSATTESRIRRLVSLGFLCEEEELLSQASTDEENQGAAGKPKLGGRSSHAFERDFQLLKDYKDTHGTTVLLAEHCQGQIKHLKKFLYSWRAHRTKHGNATQNLTSAAESKIRRLDTLGFLDEEETPVNTHRGKWASNFVLLQEYKNIHGTCAISKCNNEGRNQKLQSFYQYQSREFRKYENDPSFSTLCENQYNRLKNIGFSTDLIRSWEQPVDQIHDQEPPVEDICDNSQHAIKSDEPDV